jgi:hypothetical protein
MAGDIEDVVVVPPDPQAHTMAEVPQIKAAAASIPPAHWRANLWVNIDAAVAFANQPPLAGPGAIVFDVQDNGQVWTFYLHGSQVWTTEGQSFEDHTFTASSRFGMELA